MAEAIEKEDDEFQSPLNTEVFSIDWKNVSLTKGATALFCLLERFESQLKDDQMSNTERGKIWEALVQALINLLLRVDYDTANDETWLLLFKAFERMHDFPHPHYFLKSIDLVHSLSKEKINVLALLAMIDAIGKVDNIHADDISSATEENRILMTKSQNLFDQWKEQKSVLNSTEDLADNTRDNIRLV